MRLPPKSLVLMIALFAPGTALAQEVFVADFANHQIHVLDFVSGQKLTPIPLGIAPVKLVANEDFIFAISFHSGLVSVINVNDKAIREPINLGGFTPNDMAISPDGNFLYIASVFRFFVIDLMIYAQFQLNPLRVQESIVRSEILNGLPGVNEFNITNTAVGVSPDNATLYVGALNFSFDTFGNSSRVFAFNAADYAALGPTNASVFRTAIPSVERTPRHIVFRKDNTRAFIADSWTVMVVDSEAGSASRDTVLQTHSNPFGNNILSLSIRPDGKFLYATVANSSKVFERVANDSFSPNRTIPLTLAGESNTSFEARAVDFSADSKWVYASLNARAGFNSVARQFLLLNLVLLKEVFLDPGETAVTLILPASPPPPLLDTVPPTVASHFPLPNAVDVPVDTTVQIIFSEAMDLSTLENAFSMAASGIPSVAGSFVLAQTNLTFTPSSSLEFNTLYQVTINATASDPSGNPLPLTVFAFTTGVKPFVTTVLPLPNATKVAVDANIEITFSEAMDQNTLPGAFKMFDDGTGVGVDGTFSFPSQSKLVFNPNNDLDFSSVYKVVIGLGAKDLAGNPLADVGNRVFSFTMLPKPPQVKIITPADGSITNPAPIIKALFEPGDRDLNFTKLKLLFDGGVVSPRVDISYPVGSGNGAMNLESISLPSGLAGHKMLTHNGFVYVLGGFTAFDQPTNQIRKAAIQSDGTLGAWTNAGQLPSASISGALLANGRIYVFHSPQQACVAVINANTGNVETCIPTTPPQSSLGGETYAFLDMQDDFVYKIGGISDRRVEYSKINPNDGSLSAWEFTLALPLAAGDSRSQAQAISFRGHVYLLGGFDSNGTGSAKVFVAQANRAGRLEFWRETQGLPLGRGHGAAVVSKGQILYFGGEDANVNPPTVKSEVFFTHIKKDGTLTPWTTSGNSLPSPLFLLAAAATNKYVYISGGVNNSNNFRSAVFRSEVLVGSGLFATAVFVPGLLGQQPQNVVAQIEDSEGTLVSAASQFTIQGGLTSKASVDGSAVLTSMDPNITITAIQDAGERDFALFAGDIIPSGLSAYDIEPNGTEFGFLAILKLSWNDATNDGIVDGTNIPESSLVIKKFFGDQWVKVLPQSIDPVNNFIEAQLLSASLYALFAPDTVSPTAAIISPANDSAVAELNSPFVLVEYSDNSLIDETSVRLFFDDLDISTQATITATSASFTPDTLPSKGPHVVTLKVSDFAGNSTTISSSFTVRTDTTSPVTVFEILGASASVDGTLFMVAVSSVSISAQDSDSGVDRLELRIDGGDLQIFSNKTRFMLSKGSHLVVFSAVDIAGNREPLQTVKLSVNGTSPVTEFSVLGTSVIIGSELFMTNSSSIALTANDLGAGVGLLEYRIDNGPLIPTDGDALFLLNEGARVVSFQAVDRVGNQEPLRTRTIKVDGTGPETQLTVEGSTVSADSLSILISDSLGFIANDPVVDSAASGVKTIKFKIDGGGFQVFSGTFSLPVGQHQLSFQSEDKIGNQGSPKTVTIEVRPTVITELKLSPNTLNLKSQGQFINAVIEVRGLKISADVAPLSLKITQINGASLSSPIPLNQDTAGKSGKLQHASLGDADEDGVIDLQVKFDRKAVIAVLPIQTQVKITVQGEFSDGEKFTAEDFIRTIKPGNIPSHAGGTARHSNSKAKVSIPIGALAADANITIVSLSAVPAEEDKKRNSSAKKRKLKRRGNPFEFGPEGTQFATPIVLTLPYDPSELEGDPDSLQIAYWNPTTEAWEPLSSTVDENNRTVSAPTTHFSQYQVVEAPIPLAGPGPTFHVGEVYVYPSPALGGTSPIFHVETEAGGSVTIRVYDLAGQNVYETVLFGSPASIDDGQGPQSAYEHAWTGRIASGVYLYVVRIEKGGEEIIRSGKFAVIR